MAHFTFLEFGYGKASTDQKWHILFMACQYQCVCIIYPDIPASIAMDTFHIFIIWTSAKPRPMENSILQSLG